MKMLISRLEGRVAVITGGNSGIGLATAQRFIEEGATVYITGRRQAELDKAISTLGPKAIGVQGDVSNLVDLDRLYGQIKSEKGHIDILFANAGAGVFSNLKDVTEEHFDKHFDVNVKGLFFSVQKAIPLMRKGGSIILNASIVSNKGVENFGVYSATKAAVRSFARTWTNDLKTDGIRVNAVSPGVVVTPGYDSLMPKEQIQGFVDAMTAQIPLGRVGKESEIAAAVAFLASDDASFISGIELTVDGVMSQV